MKVRATETKRRARGQGLVEFALVLPLILLLLLGAIDFGRVFLGWVTLNNMARVGANYAALHPDLSFDQAKYDALIAANATGINCVEAAPRIPPTYGGTRQPGETVTVRLTCRFTPLTPIISSIFPTGLITLGASSAFPVTGGCIGNCSGGSGGPGPGGTPSDNCRAVPNVVGLSVMGARRAWVANGFTAANFSPASGSDTRSVATQRITLPTGADACPTGKAFFLATLTVTLTDLQTPKPTPTCIYVPNMLGMSVVEARTAWTDAGFSGPFMPATGQDTNIVDTQTTSPATPPDVCAEPATSVEVSYVAAPPPPPAAPCQVPSLVNTPSTSATATWTSYGFTGTLTFNKPNRLPYTIKSQSLVGNTYAPCSSTMQVGP